MRKERETLEVIDALGVACAENSKEFRNIVEITADVFTAPIAAITVLDRETQWFFAAQGLRANHGARCDAFCDITVRSDAPFIVEDAAADPVFAANPYVTADPHLRFYAGAPIILGPGLRLGALIVIDRAPRRIDSSQARQLERLAAVAAEAFKLRGEVVRAQRHARSFAGREAVALEQNDVLRETQEVFEVASELAKFGSWSVDLKKDRLAWSQGTRRIHGVPDDFDVTLQHAIEFYEPEVRPLIEEKISLAIEQGVGFRIEQPIKTLQGERRWVRSLGRVERGPDGTPTRIYGCAIDVTEERERQAIIERLATRDALTNLLNRRSVEEHFERRDGGSAGPISAPQLLLLDLDHFKMINDGEGHDVGDKVLQSLAAILQRCAGPSDLVARLGGDEFLMVIEAADDATAGRRAADDVLDAVRANPYFRARTTPISVSIGLLDLAMDKLGFAEALKHADIALYEAKRMGRNRVAAYQPSLGAAFVRRRDELAGMGAALEEQRVIPVYQMQRRLSDGRLLGFEALARVRDLERGLLSPAMYQAAFDDPACAAKISNVVLERAVADAADWRRRGLEFGQISVNVAELQLLDESFEEWLDDLLLQHGLAHGDLVLELTESILLSHRFERMKARLVALQERGVAVAFDDFGTGYASLTHLRMLKIDQLKIDRSFIGPLLSDPTCLTIAQGVVQMARTLGVETVAEGVETPETAARLRAFGCDVAQGYLFSKPVPFEEVIELLHRESQPLLVSL